MSIGPYNPDYEVSIQDSRLAQASANSGIYASSENGQVRHGTLYFYLRVPTAKRNTVYEQDASLIVYNRAALDIIASRPIRASGGDFDSRDWQTDDTVLTLYAQIGGYDYWEMQVNGLTPTDGTIQIGVYFGRFSRHDQNRVARKTLAARLDADIGDWGNADVWSVTPGIAGISQADRGGGGHKTRWLRFEVAQYARWDLGYEGVVIEMLHTGVLTSTMVPWHMFEPEKEVFVGLTVRDNRGNQYRVTATCNTDQGRFRMSLNTGQPDAGTSIRVYLV